jgi:PTH1 family peptidyl-tRNA hydrolase
MAADVLASRAAASFARRAHGRALAAAARIGVAPGGLPGPRAVLVKPQTFMNLAGGPTAELANYFGVSYEQVVVIHDDLDLPPWEVRVKRGGGEGGHNGLRDITKALGTRDYLRVRLGIGRPPGSVAAADFVLRDFPGSQAADVALLADKAADAVERLIIEGLAATQLVFHTRPEAAREPGSSTGPGRAGEPGAGGPEVGAKPGGGIGPGVGEPGAGGPDAGAKPGGHGPAVGEPGDGRLGGEGERPWA